MDWKKIKAEYISGGTSYRKLCAKYGVSRTTLERKAKEGNWAALRRQAEDKTEAKIVESVSDKGAQVDKKYFSLVDKLLSKAEEVIDKTPVWQIGSIKEMATALKYIKECKGVKSEAEIREQTARIANLERQAETEDTHTEVTVVFEGAEDGSKWAK